MPTDRVRLLNDLAEATQRLSEWTKKRQEAYNVWRGMRESETSWSLHVTALVMALSNLPPEPEAEAEPQNTVPLDEKVVDAAKFALLLGARGKMP